MTNQKWKKGLASLAMVAMMQPGFALAQNTASAATAAITIAPKSSDAVQKFVVTPTAEATLTSAQ